MKIVRLILLLLCASFLPCATALESSSENDNDAATTAVVATTPHHRMTKLLLNHMLFMETNVDLVVSLLTINEPVDGLQDGQRVTFNERTGKVGSKAIFLKGVKQTSPRWVPVGFRKFTATYVSDAEAARIVKETRRIPFFYVHGWGNQVSINLREGKKLKQKFQRRQLYYSIPVLWPTINVALTPAVWRIYKNDQRDAVKAGDLFRDLNMDEFPPNKAIMMHSMGNHLIVSSFQKQFSTKFQNIFMVAADVPYDIFSGNPKNNDDFKDYETKTSNMVDALNDDGMVTITSREQDIPLFISGDNQLFNNKIQRIGFKGPNSISNPKKVKHIDVSDKRYRTVTNHDYQYQQFMIDVYDEAVLTNSSF